MRLRGSFIYCDEVMYEKSGFIESLNMHFKKFFRDNNFKISHLVGIVAISMSYHRRIVYSR